MEVEKEKRVLIHVKVLSENKEIYDETVNQFKEIMRWYAKEGKPYDFLWLVTTGKTDVSIVDESYLKDMPREALVLLKEKIDKILVNE